MTDDALIAGAAAPTRRRWITAASSLDAVWVLVVGAGLGVSSLFDLIDLPTARLRTGAAPLRVFVVVLPLVACGLAIVATWRRSVIVAAAATGVLAPGLALAGSLSISLFLDEASAFADVGVAISLGVALLGVVMLVRWLVYHPLSLLEDEARPMPAASRALVLAGAGTGLAVVIGGLDDSRGAAWVGATAAMLLVPGLVVLAGMARTLPVVVLAAAAAVAQIIGVLAVKAEQSTIPWDSDLVLRTGVIGLAGLCLATVLSIVAVFRAEPDAVSETIVDDEPWRWSADD